MNVYKDKLVRVLLIIFTLFIFYSIPLFIFNGTQKKLLNLEIKEDLNQLSMWAELYNNRYKTYQGMENNEEIKKIIDELNSLQTDCQLIISKRGDKFCAKAKMFDKKIKNWCVDSARYSGSIINNCDYDKEIRCE